ncbi:MFS transporter [Polaribacter haliotis]|uniref:MFS transporter n=1 Tax=Polaribacter haliotis TaxID=1888915 RepID=A0A7L8AJ72_9FLAO|nr:MFS transporter [Polaribacter haliotis]QOD62052.1 MFS transporter [Polaribacter haliotis]
MKEKLKVIKIIHLALCLGVLLGYFIIGDLKSFDFLKIPSINSSSVIYLLIPLIAYVLSNYLYKKKLQNISSKKNLEDNMVEYQSASIIRWAILEYAAFAILILNKIFLIFGILIILYLSLLHPTEDKIKNDIDNFGS